MERPGPKNDGKVIDLAELRQRRKETAEKLASDFFEKELPFFITSRAEKINFLQEEMKKLKPFEKEQADKWIESIKQILDSIKSMAEMTKKDMDTIKQKMEDLDHRIQRIERFLEMRMR